MARRLRDVLYRKGEAGLAQVVSVVLPEGSPDDLPDWLMPARRTVPRMVWCESVDQTVQIGGLRDRACPDVVRVARDEEVGLIWISFRAAG